METRDEHLKREKEELGEQDFEAMYPKLDNDYYAMVEDEVKSGKTISRAVYDSLTVGQRFHFNKHYNYRGDKVCS